MHWRGIRCASLVVVILVRLSAGASAVRAEDAGLTNWKPAPDAFLGATVADGKLTLESGQWRDVATDAGRWGFVVSPTEHADAGLELTATIVKPAAEFAFFGENCSAWRWLNIPTGAMCAWRLARSRSASRCA
jgi:hypothetical protein